MNSAMHFPVKEPQKIKSSICYDLPLGALLVFFILAMASPQVKAQVVIPPGALTQEVLVHVGQSLDYGAVPLGTTRFSLLDNNQGSVGARGKAARITISVPLGRFAPIADFYIEKNLSAEFKSAGINMRNLRCKVNSELFRPCDSQNRIALKRYPYVIHIVANLEFSQPLRRSQNRNPLGYDILRSQINAVVVPSVSVPVLTRIPVEVKVPSELTWDISTEPVNFGTMIKSGDTSYLLRPHGVGVFKHAGGLSRGTIEPGRTGKVTVSTRARWPEDLNVELVIPQRTDINNQPFSLKLRYNTTTHPPALTLQRNSAQVYTIEGDLYAKPNIQVGDYAATVAAIFRATTSKDAKIVWQDIVNIPVKFKVIEPLSIRTIRDIEFGTVLIQSTRGGGDIYTLTAAGRQNYRSQGLVRPGQYIISGQENRPFHLRVSIPTESSSHGSSPLYLAQITCLWDSGSRSVQVCARDSEASRSFEISNESGSTRLSVGARIIKKSSASYPVGVPQHLNFAIEAIYQ